MLRALAPRHAVRRKDSIRTKNYGQVRATIVIAVSFI